MNSNLHREGEGEPTSVEPIVALAGVGLHYGKIRALDDLRLELHAGACIGVIGPDGVGKSSLLALVAGARAIQSGQVRVLGQDMSNTRQRRSACTKIAYMPQGLGKNLYPTLSVMENLDFFARLFGHPVGERVQRINYLAEATSLMAFLDRPAGKLSGGMKQKLGLCCALMHDPELLILDEPTMGLDPLSRSRFWELVEEVRTAKPGITILVATAYMAEATQFDQLLAMDEGRILANATPETILHDTQTQSLEAAFLALLPREKRQHYQPVNIPPLATNGQNEVAIKAYGLTMKFGNFVAVDQVNFEIRRGEIFGFVGSNGCGKTTTMKMLTGLLVPNAGRIQLFGREIDARDLAIRKRVGYMSQSFSLYGELTVRQNLELHAQLFQLDPGTIPQRVDAMLRRFELEAYSGQLPLKLTLGHRQRLSLAVALIHEPELLILDEPTSGVDPVARDGFWNALAELSRNEGVTIFVSTHFMNEAQRCDRVALMHEGRVLATDTPAALVALQGAGSLEDAFITYLKDADGEGAPAEFSPLTVASNNTEPAVTAEAARRQKPRALFEPGRWMAIARRESLELVRDPIRLTLALAGSVLLMLVMGYGISLDVEDLKFAVLDRDQTATSREYIDNIAGSQYFIKRRPLTSYAELDRRMRSGELSVAIEIPPGFARDFAAGRAVEIGAWVDGSMPMRGETASGFIRGLHLKWLSSTTHQTGLGAAATQLFELETRYRYNPDIKSLVAMVPAVIPLLLMLIPAMLATLSVVREKELGSITNFYVTPTTRLEFLLGKQLPYVTLSLVSYLLLTAMALTLFQVELKGSFATLTLAALLYVIAATGTGFLISIFMRTQIAALFGTAVLTIVPAISFSGMIDPVSALEGTGRVIGEVYPTTHFLTISRGVFSKALGFADLHTQLISLAVYAIVITAFSAILLRKQAG